MRVTNVQFRSPKQKTPVGYIPITTRRGQFLFEAPVRSGTSFGSDRRFRDYQFEAKRVGPSVGPSTYDITRFTISELPVKGGCKYLPINKTMADQLNAYVMIGDSAVYQQEWNRWKPQGLSSTLNLYNSKRTPIKRPQSAKRRRSISRRSNTPKGKSKIQQFRIVSLRRSD